MDYSTKFISATKDYCTFLNFVPAPYIRKTFSLNFKPQKAELLITGLGFYELWVNGKNITKSKLAPYISNPNHLIYYDRYDLTSELHEGKNSFGFILGNGMQNCFGGYGWALEKNRWRSAPKMALCFEAENGSEKISFEADDSFKIHPSPIYLDDIRVGEFYDATKEIEGWNLPDFDDSDWDNAIKVSAPSGECREGKHTVIRAIREITPIKFFKSKISLRPRIGEDIVKPNTPEDEKVNEGILYDFGENFTGLCRLKIKGRKGQKVILQFGEKYREGGLDLKNMPFDPDNYCQRDIYICKGEGIEEWTPMFTFHGFRYCLVIGIDESQATEDLLTYVVMHADVKPRAKFRCSDELTNKLYAATMRSNYSNFFYFPTDCPHREKNGYTGDAQLSAEQFLLNFSAEDTLKEWLFSIRKAQNEKGQIPIIIPTADWGYEWGTGPAWDCAITEIPYRIWQYRGDTEVLEQNATAIVRYLTFLMSKRDERGLIHFGLGDWCQTARPDNTYTSPLEFTDSVISMDLCRKAAKIFRVLGKNELSDLADRVADELREAVRKNLIHENLEVAGKCQTVQAMSIFYDIFNEDEKLKAFEHLLRYIHDKNNSIDVGILGSRVMFHVLSEYGYDELAFHMISKPEYPSYASWIVDYDATTLFERVARAPEQTSFNHHFFGDISAWFIKNLAGINPNPNCDNPDYVIVSPAFINSLDYAEGEYKTPNGKVSVKWVREKEKINLYVEVYGGVLGKIKLKNRYFFTDNTNECDLKSGVYTIKIL